MIEKELSMNLSHPFAKTIPPQGKAVLITGCSSGIGQACALWLARQGFTVYATVRKEADAQRLRQLQVPNLLPLCPLDLTRREDIPAVLDAVTADLERRGQLGLYALLHNAGGGQVAPVELMDLDLFQRELQARLVGAAALTQAFLPLLRQGKGRIVWIQTPALIPTRYVTSIHACDFAANCLARTLALELKPWNIPSVLVRCGGIQTPAGQHTPDGVAHMLRHPLAGLYREVLEQWGSSMVDFDRHRSEPEVVAQVVERALCARHPRHSYQVGYMSGLAAFLEILPEPWADSILARAV
jgi:NAD(P)-dependent dehydrogenase (short-subunit alcohol dehydrogenase family)